MVQKRENPIFTRRVSPKTPIETGFGFSKFAIGDNHGNKYRCVLLIIKEVITD